MYSPQQEVVLDGELSLNLNIDGEMSLDLHMDGEAGVPRPAHGWRSRDGHQGQ